VPNMAEIIGCDPTNVHVTPTRLQGFKWFLLIAQGVVNPDSHIAIFPWAFISSLDYLVE